LGKLIASVLRPLTVAGAELLACCCTAPIGAILSGIITTRAQDYRIALLLGQAFCIVGFALLTLLDTHSHLGLQVGPQVLVGLGSGLIIPAANMASQLGVPDHLQIAALNLTTFFRNLGGTFGIAICGVVFQSEFDNLVSRKLSAEVRHVISGREAEAASSQIKELPAGLQSVYRDIYADSIRRLWIGSATVGGIALLVTLAAKRYTTAGRGLTSNQSFQSRGKPEQG